MILGVIIRYAIVTFLINYVEISFPRFNSLIRETFQVSTTPRSQPERASAFQASKRIMVLNRVSGILGQEYHIFGNETQRFCALYMNDRR